MISTLPDGTSPPHGRSKEAWPWGVSLVVYALFSAAVFAIQGPEPPLGPDHLTYMQLADSILAACADGADRRETSSIRFYGVLLAYLYGWTGSHVLSMKIVLAVFSILFLLASQLFFGLFTRSHRQATLFALLSGFAVSFGFASWGVTDSAALLPRTLVAPVSMFCMWFWLRFDGSASKYLVFPILTFFAVAHLSVFYLIGVLLVVEIVDFAAVRRFRLDWRIPALLGSLLITFGSLLVFEYSGITSKSLSQFAPDTMRAVGLQVGNVDALESVAIIPCVPPKAQPDASPAKETPAAATSTGAAVQDSLQSKGTGVDATGGAARSTAPKSTEPMSAQEAWRAELSARPWRNMPMPMANVANALSSSALVLLLAVAGMIAARREGYSRFDRLMLAMFFAVPIFAFAPQTALWVIRSFKPIYPATIEEVRALGLIMIPALYFVLRLYRLVIESGRPHAFAKGAAIVVAVLALPLALKNLPVWAREGLLSAMIGVHALDAKSESGMMNARVALGILPGSSSLYYSTRGVRDWLERNTPPQSRILTDRDDLVLLPDRVILGPRQVAVNIYKAGPEQAKLFLETSGAMAGKDLEHLRRIALDHSADVVVVNWRVEGAPYADDMFSVVPVRDGIVQTRR